jgi:hypothetical protein
MHLLGSRSVILFPNSLLLYSPRVLHLLCHTDRVGNKTLTLHTMAIVTCRHKTQTQLPFVFPSLLLLGRLPLHLGLG